MKPIKFIFLLVLVTQTVFAQRAAVNQFAAIDRKALQLPDSLTNTTDQIVTYITSNFETDNDRVRAIFIWIASNIEYDIDNMFAINFHETREERIEKSLRTRKGICENYAALFTDICTKVGIKSFVISGYTKQNGVVDNIPHAWNAAFIEGSWFLFDPTWGSGHVSNRRFVRRINNDYFKVRPETLIRSHMPFDYLWQFLEYPITNREFYDGRTQQDRTKPFFNFNDTLQFFQEMSHIDQLISSADRIEKNGVINSLVFDKLRQLRLEIENYKQTEIVNLHNHNVDLYNSSVVDYNDAINYYNEFINYKNRQFTPMKTDPEIQEMLNLVSNKLQEAKIKLEQISNPDANMLNLIRQLTRSIDDVSNQLKEQQTWLKQYFSRGRLGRRSMFHRVTWFGIPLN